MPRPKKNDDDRRTETLAFRLTPAERLRIEQAAVAAGLSASEYARELTLTGRVVMQQRLALDPAAFDQLRRIGVNLNQLARLANQTKHVPAELTRACAAVEQFILRQLTADPSLTAPPPRPDGPGRPGPHGP
jgi:hypothetical protein